MGIENLCHSLCSGRATENDHRDIVGSIIILKKHQYQEDIDEE